MSDMISPWAQIWGGGKVDFEAPVIDRLYPLVRSIAGIRRFNGHTTFPIWVTVHSVAVARMVSPAAAPYGLLHDLHEGAIGDIPTPVKHVLGLQGKAALLAVTDRLDAAIWHCAGLEPPSPAILDEVKRADLIALMTEKRDALHPEPAPWGINALPRHDLRYSRCSAVEGLSLFLDEAYRWLPTEVAVQLAGDARADRDSWVSDGWIGP